MPAAKKLTRYNWGYYVIHGKMRVSSGENVNVMLPWGTKCGMSRGRQQCSSFGGIGAD